MLPGDSILLTGASGFVGSFIRTALAQVPSLKTLGRGPENDYQCDLSLQVPELTESFHTVIHCAGKAHMVPRNEQEAEKFFQVNVQGTKNLLQGIQQSAKMPAEFVFISSVSVYGTEVGEDISEVHPTSGQTPYARSKIIAEEFLQSWATVNKITLTILRLPLVVGQNPPGNLGAMIKAMNSGFYVGIGSGAARKSMVLAEDVAMFVRNSSAIGGTYNLTDGHHPSMVQLESAIAKQLGRTKPSRMPDFILRQVSRVGDLFGNRFPINSVKFHKLTSTLTFSDDKARNYAGWRPRSVIDHLPKLKG